MPPQPTSGRTLRASVIGSGPNGLSAAIVLAQAGLDVTLYEGQPTPGGAARTLPLTLPGFLHDAGSAVHPLAAGSPFFASLPLERYGLRWLDSPAWLAHPFDDGSALTPTHSLCETESALGADGPAWRRLFAPLAARWHHLAPDILGPLPSVPRHPFLMARFGLEAVRTAERSARRHFRDDRTRALFAGLAAHSFLPLDAPLTASFALVLAAAGHAVGWPIPQGGAQALADALAAHLVALGGRIHLSTPVRRLAELPPSDLVLCDVSPRQLLQLTGQQLSGQPISGQRTLSPAYRRQLGRFRYGPAAFKVDYALSRPIPWAAPECLRSATVHLGGGFAEIVASERAMASGTLSDRPFVLLSQPTLFDPSRVPSIPGEPPQHIAWAYCHVPNGTTDATLPHIEALVESQIERFAPGFSHFVLARHVFTPADLEAQNPNLIGGDVVGGLSSLRQLVNRPTPALYRTSNRSVYLCSASTPPGGGVHGMCGFHAAATALRDHGLPAPRL